MEEKQALQLIVNFINTKAEAKIAEFNQVNQALEILESFVDVHLAERKQPTISKKSKNK